MNISNLEKIFSLALNLSQLGCTELRGGVMQNQVLTHVSRAGSVTV
jgi:hypothetical protein